MSRVSDGVPMPDGADLLISAMWAFVTVDPTDHTEGVIAITAGGVAYPLVGADAEMVERLKPHAARLASAIAAPVSLVRFTERTVVIDDILVDQP